MRFKGHVKMLRFFSSCVTCMCLLVSLPMNHAMAEDAPKVYRIMVGDFEVVTLSDGLNKRTIEQQIQLLKGDSQKLKERLDSAYPSGQVESTVNAFLIDTGTKLILVDAGNGLMGSPTMGNVIHNLRAAGYKPEEIDEIYLTHMHGDHIGGLVTGNERVFPKAIVYASRSESEYWMNDGNLNDAPASAKRTFQAAKTALTPYINAGKFVTFEKGAQLTPGIKSELLPGHTPGHTAYCIESKGNVLVLWGDIIHVEAVQFADPSVTISFDSDQTVAAKTRQWFLAEAARKNWLIGGAHLSFPGIGSVKSNPIGGYNFSPID